MKRISNYIGIALLFFIVASCTGDLVKTPELETFSVNLKQGSDMKPLSEGATVINGDTLIFEVNASGDHIILNTPFEPLNLEDEQDAMPVEIEYPFMDDTLKGTSKDYTLELVVTNVYDGENIERSRESFKLTAQDTTTKK